MNERPSLVIPLAGGCLVALLLVLWLVLKGWPTSPTGQASPAAAHAEKPAAKEATDLRSSGSGKEMLAYLQSMLEKSNARSHEALLTFANTEAYERFLARAQREGLTVIGKIDGLLTVRVRYDSLVDLQTEIKGNMSDYADIGANHIVNIPQTPAKDDRAATTLVALGGNLRSFLGVTGDVSLWGQGVTIAVLDSGVVADTTFGQGRLHFLDVGLGTAPGSGTEDGHGTAVASLAAGMSVDAPGVAPSADILSIRVTGPNGDSDIFTLSQAILTAVDAGAQIINISLGSYETANLLINAITYAEDHGVVIVASAGNDQATQLTWPAADSRVVSVGAVDALEQQATFSNAGPQLQITAPGCGVLTAWLGGQRIYFDGTSASAPIIAGAIAAIMSTSPGLTASQAWEILKKYADDVGQPGADSDFGNGVVNLGWAMARNDSTRIDTAISSTYYDGASETMEYVIQNRSGQSINGMVLSVDVGGSTTTFSVPLLAPGASNVALFEVDQSQLALNGSLLFRAQLENPDGVVDAVPANNRRLSSLSAPKK